MDISTPDWVILNDSVGHESHRGILADLVVRIGAENEQPVSAGGLRFSLEIRNDGRAAVVLLNPLDSMQVLLLDRLGFPLDLPPGTPPRTRVHVTDPRDIQRPYQILRVENSRGDKGLLETVHDETLKLGPQTTHTIEMLIREVVDPRSGKSASVPLPPGGYKLSVVMPLITPGGKSNRIVRSDKQLDITMTARN